MRDEGRSDFDVVFTRVLCSANRDVRLIHNLGPGVLKVSGLDLELMLLQI